MQWSKCAHFLAMIVGAWSVHVSAESPSCSGLCPTNKEHVVLVQRQSSYVRQTSAPVYESKVGRGGCSNVLLNTGGWTDEASVQQKCSELSCAFYTWSNDPNDAKGGAWFCSDDNYNTADNGAQYTQWKVGRPQPGRPKYESKVGRGGCPTENLLLNAGGFTNEASVQEKCNELGCAYYTWSNDNAEAKGGAWFCSIEAYTDVDNSADWPQWRVGRPAPYESKVGRGGCPDNKLLAHSGGWTSEASVQQRCSELSCAFYTWSNDDNDAKSGAWFCSKDNYDNNANGADWPQWKVGRPEIREVYGEWTITRMHAKWGTRVGSKVDQVCGKSTDTFKIATSPSKYCAKIGKGDGQVVVNQDGVDRTSAWFCSEQGETEIVGTPTFKEQGPDGACANAHAVEDSGDLEPVKIRLQ